MNKSSCADMEQYDLNKIQLAMETFLCPTIVC